jgi:putative aldouronate transport system substrate-binding protein
MFSQKARHGIFPKGILLIGLILLATLFMGATKLFEYPLATKDTLTYLMEPTPYLTALNQNFGETVLAKTLAKRTGVKCKYLHPPEGKIRETIDLLAAIDELPDIMECDWATYPGGPQAALTKGTILRLNKIFKQYAPNLCGRLKNYPDWERQIKTDAGDYYVFPSIRADERLLVTSGPVIRKDWLEELRLADPETPEEWYRVLKAFKDKKKAIAPLSMTLAQLQTDLGGGFDICGEQHGFYVEERIVKFSFNTPQYKRFLMTMNRWFAAGLLDSNFANLTLKNRETNLYDGKTGIVDVSAGSLGAWIGVMRKNDPQFQMTGLKFAAPKKGEKAKFARRLTEYAGNSGGNAALSGTCKNIEAAARLLDYNYSEAGSMLLNFGLENISYKMVNDYPKFTDLVTKNPQLSMTKVLSQYVRANFNGPFIQDGRAAEQYYNLPQQKEAQRLWLDNDCQKYLLPALTFDDQETSQIGPINNEIHSYVTRMSISFIMGIEPFNHYESYVSHIDQLGLNRVLKVYQKAYNRYVKR